MKMFASSRMPRVIQKRVERNGLCGTGLAGFWAGGLAAGGGLDTDADGTALRPSPRPGARRLPRPDSDQQQPGASDHENERRHHPQANRVKSPSCAEEKDDRARLLDYQARIAAKRAHEHAPIGGAGGRPDAGVEDDLDYRKDDDQLDRDRLR